MRLSSYVANAFRSDFAKKVIETYLTQILSLGINFLSIIFISRSLGPTSRGVLATAMAVVALGVQFGNIGLHASNTYFVAQDRNLLPTVVGNTFMISALLGSLISLIIWGGFLIEPSLVPVDGPVLLFASLLIPLSLAHLLFQNILIGVHEVRTYNKVEIFIKMFIFLFVLSLFLLHVQNVEIILIANLLALVIGIYFIWMKIRSLLPARPLLSVSFFKKSLSYGFRSYSAAFFSFLVMRIDILMVKHILGFEHTGYYSIAVNLADIINIFPAIIGSLLFPKILAVADRNERLKMVKKIAFGVFILMTIFGAGCFVFAKWGIVFLLGQAFAPAVPAFLWLLPGLILLSVNVIFMNYFASIGIPWIMIFSPGFAAFANIIMNLVMIPSMGIIGASISSTICYGGMLLMSLLYIRFKRVEQVSYAQM